MKFKKYITLSFILVICIWTLHISSYTNTNNPTNILAISPTPFQQIVTATPSNNPTDLQTIEISLSPTPTDLPTPTPSPIPTPSPTKYLPTPPKIIVDLGTVDIAYANTLDKTHYCGVSNKASIDFLKKFGGIYKKDNGLKRIYLTYNLGSEYGLTNKLLDVLREKNAKASFFPLGSYTAQNLSIIKRIVHEGHLLGSHGEVHENQNKWPIESVINDMDKIQKRYKGIFGEDFSIVYYRPPYGYTCERNLYIAQQRGLISVFWTYSYVDWNTKAIGNTEYIYNLYMNNLQDGMVTQFHIANRETVDVLARFIDSARSLGYEFYRLDD